jgi:hypothetical protein
VRLFLIFYRKGIAPSPDWLEEACLEPVIGVFHTIPMLLAVRQIRSFRLNRVLSRLLVTVIVRGSELYPPNSFVSFRFMLRSDDADARQVMVQ